MKKIISLFVIVGLICVLLVLTQKQDKSQGKLRLLNSSIGRYVQISLTSGKDIRGKLENVDFDKRTGLVSIRLKDGDKTTSVTFAADEIASVKRRPAGKK